MKYIESLREGEKVNEVYLCKFKQAALTKAGKAYDNVILQDKTGTIAGLCGGYGRCHQFSGKSADVDPACTPCFRGGH